jgi:hypothetical protein
MKIAIQTFRLQSGSAALRVKPRRVLARIQRAARVGSPEMKRSIRQFLARNS